VLIILFGLGLQRVYTRKRKVMSGTQALLTEYANGGSERAFRELVSSYVNFVFSTALRIVGGDRPLAEDVTQAVFTDLSRKAVSLPKDVQLGGWLHRHTCFIARKTLRRERRRIAREKQAMELHSIEDYTDANLAQLGLVLDEVINDLGEEDRNAIVLRFFEQRDFRSIGEALGSSEDAARMRVSRAVDKIGALLKRRGIVLTAAGISFVLGGKLATAAPNGLATRIVYVELARPAKGQGIFEVLREACFTRLNIGLVSAAVILALLVLLVSGRHSRAKALPDSDGKAFTPAEFADLAVEESDNQNTVETAVAVAEPAAAPAPSVASVAPARIDAPVVQAVKVKPVVVNVPPVQPPQSAQESPPIATVPRANGGGSGQAMANAQAYVNGSVSSQRPRRYFPPQVAPQTPAPQVATNSANATVVKAPPNLLTNSGGWTSIRTTAPVEPGTISPGTLTVSGNQSPVQPVRPGPRIVPPSRLNDPRKKDRQP
jgi:RNA polymerase sigma factor (sigma-70 family)